ncbi:MULTISPECIES: 30S ribosome-binding factor RbfA [Desulfofundulus]|uniref:Ribosome-binding factor A n=1 Tax=Desulfofundulus australicus DSM 11792 TaxID=1121425 RepID=A0A1M4UPE0_9FIRM|nr:MULTISPECIES: 30S ribosome-binding factor RbfA [Desulfofundulus]MBE3585623.1 30S ribosome-binding factor RbfA [Thermoanaerobacter sp.]MCS5696105.1 30S ribosome-binding factor RbfA [Desulfofundulus thermocisternus]MDK2887174.1 ribosome-binding factor [Thermoanaerobacter sp.]SHE58576.1 ribosome-binding factor A [Desulfofundulus australicus DSM 11792]
MSYRPERLAEIIKKEVSDMVRDELKDPRIGFVTITGVEVSTDLRYAKIFFSVLGSEEEARASLEALNRARGYVRSELARRIRLRHAPEISFKLDPSIQRGIRVMELLKDVKERGAAGNDWPG